MDGETNGWWKEWMVVGDGWWKGMDGGSEWMVEAKADPSAEGWTAEDMEASMVDASIGC